MDYRNNRFIELDRTFHELAVDAKATDDTLLGPLLGKQKKLHWADLLAFPRVVLLAEAGSGKTAEVRQAAKRMRVDGKNAFFLRIESVVKNFETAFEVGTFHEFLDWCASGEEGWLLLDSVDEARLRDPKDFEHAIRVVGHKLAPVMRAAHVLITSRSSAWRTTTDPLLCTSVFPYEQDRFVHQDGSENSEELVEAKKKSSSQSPFGPFKIVALDDLGAEQIDAFLHGHGVANAAAFRMAVEQKDVIYLMSRPQDLSELAAYWNDHARIGSKLDLLRHSIDRRLVERDQDRADARPISAEKLRAGVRLVAAAATLTQTSSIQAPDGSGAQTGLVAREILRSWDERDLQSLLQRPIFEAGEYGAVRFHHRSVREYLTAEWLHQLLNDHAPRLRIEELFFRNQYGIEVVVPSMRPILPWLAILHAPILDRVIRVAPEILFEGGDPSQFDCNTRIRVLREVCEHLAQPPHVYSASDFSAIQLFVNTDMTEVIRELLGKHAGNSDITWILLRMVWRGEIAGALSEAKKHALAGRDVNTRIAAFRALEAIGSAADLDEVRDAFLSGDGVSSRGWLAELAEGMRPDVSGVDWLLGALAKSDKKRRYEYDQLTRVLERKISTLPAELLPRLLDGFSELLKVPPLVDRLHDQVSVKNSWLTKSSFLTLARMVGAKHPDTLGSSALGMLSMLPSLITYEEDFKVEDPNSDLSLLVPSWPELNRALFWHSVSEERKRCEAKGERLPRFWGITSFHAYWRFSEGDFQGILVDVGSRPELEERLIAQSLAFAIYRQSGRPAKWRREMKRAANSEPELKNALHALLNPPVNELDRFRKEDARYKKQAKARQDREELNRRNWKNWLSENVENLRRSAKPGVPSNPQHYLHNQIRERETSSGKWSEGDWQALISEFGEPVARAYRDGAVSFWRDYKPVLRSEGAAENSTPFAVILGLTGLAIEAKEVEGWEARLTPEEAGLASRYGLLELNGFPTWLPSLFSKHPRVLLEVVDQEIDFELRHDRADSHSNYLLSTVSWSGSWIWDSLAPSLLTRLGRSPKSPNTLGHALDILHGSSLTDSAIAKLSAKKARSTKNLRLGALWFASWVGVQPDVAIPTLAAHLAVIGDPKDQALFAMNFITALVGGRRKAERSRGAYRIVSHMKALYLLMHRYIRESEDIDRAGKGVYSPGLRDDAQDARNALISFIKETPGKEAYLAMMEVSVAHPSETARPWMAHRAKEKATLDADIEPWSVDQVLSFHSSLERTPRSHRELWYLAIDRIRDYGHDLEHGNTSTAKSLRQFAEPAVRQFIGAALQDRAQSRYSISQESELADAKKPDILFHGSGFGSVPCELKLANKWSGPDLFERLEIQLCGDYLRDRQSDRGIFLLVYGGGQKKWMHPNGTQILGFNALVAALQNYWLTISPQFSEVDDVRVMGIDLTRRGIDAKESSLEKSGARKAADPRRGRGKVAEKGRRREG